MLQTQCLEDIAVMWKASHYSGELKTNLQWSLGSSLNCIPDCVLQTSLASLETNTIRLNEIEADDETFTVITVVI